MKAFLLVLSLIIPFFPASARQKVTPNLLKTESTAEFVQNRGQFIHSDGSPAKDVLFVADVSGKKLYVRNTGISYVLSRLTGCLENLDASNINAGNPFTKNRPPSRSLPGCPADDLPQATANPDPVNGGLPQAPFCQKITTVRIDMDISGMNPDVMITGVEKLDSYNNYYLAHCPDGITHVPSFRKIVYENAYKNIDMALYDNNGQPEYDFVLRPGADPSVIKLAIKSADMVRVDRYGNLVIESALGKIEHIKPYSYQTVNGRKIEVGSSFNLGADGSVGFVVKDYDRSKNLVIDPLVRLWGTYFGDENGVDYLVDIQYLKNGNFCAVGSTNSLGSIASPGAHQDTLIARSLNREYDAFLVMFDSDGRKLWGTYYGGIDNDGMIAVDCDRNNNIITIGYSNSSSGIATQGAYLEVSSKHLTNSFLVKFNSSGLRLWGTYYYSQLQDIQCDDLGHIYVTGYANNQYTLSTPGAYKTVCDSIDVILTKFKPDGSLDWCTYYGGNNSEYAKSIAVDSRSNAIITGYTNSNDGIAVNSSFLNDSANSFIAKFDSSGMIVWGTYALAAGAGNIINSVISDSRDNIIVIGYSFDSTVVVSSPDAWQKKNNGKIDIVLAKFNPGGQRKWATYFGGRGDEHCFHYQNISCDKFDNIVFTDITTSTDNIATLNAYKTYKDPYWATPFLSVFSPGGKRLYGTYYACGQVYPYGITVNNNNDIFVCGSANTDSCVATPGTHKPSHTAIGSPDGFVICFNAEFFGLKLSAYDSLMKKKIDTLDFGKVCLGESRQRRFVLKNESDIPILLDRILLDDTLDFDIRILGKADLDPSDTTSVLVTFKAGKTGRFDQTLRIMIKNEVDTLKTLRLTGFVVNSELEFTGSGDFGSLQINEKMTRVIKLINKGNASSYIETIPDLKPPFLLKSIKPDLPFLLKPGDSLTLTIEFVSAGSGNFSQSFMVSGEMNNDACPGSAEILLNAKITDFNISIKPGILDFGLIAACSSKTDSIILTNKSEKVFTLKSRATVAGADAALFNVITEPAAPVLVKPGDSVKYIVGYTPAKSATGKHNAELSIKTDIINTQEITLPLRAESELPGLAISPASLDFGPSPTGQPSVLPVYIKNKGRLEVRISRFEPDNTGLEVNPQSYTLRYDEQKKFDIIWTPASPGIMEGKIYVIIDEPCPDTLAIDIAGQALDTASGDLSITGSIEFGQVPYCLSKQDSVVVVNNGDTPVEIKEMSVTGADAALFDFAGNVTLPIVLNKKERLVRIVNYNGSASADGIKSAIVRTVALIDGSEKVFSTSIRAERVSISISINPPGLSFPETKPGANAPIKVTLKNDSPLPVTIRNVGVRTFTNVFGISPNKDIDLDPQQETECDVVFAPLTEGDYTDELIFTVNMDGCQANLIASINAESKKDKDTVITHNEIINALAWLPDTSARVGDLDFGIPLLFRLDRDTAIKSLSYTARIRFDATAFVPRTATDAIITDNRIAYGDRIVELSGTKSIESNSDTVLCRFNGQVYLGNSEVNTLTLEDFRLSDTNIRASRQNGILRVKGLCQQNLSKIKFLSAPALSVAPNPAGDKAEIMFSCDENGLVTIEIFNLHGEKVETRQLVKNGRQASLDLDLGNYAPGLYQVVAKIGAQRLSEKLSVVK